MKIVIFFPLLLMLSYGACTVVLLFVYAYARRLLATSYIFLISEVQFLSEANGPFPKLFMNN